MTVEWTLFAQQEMREKLNYCELTFGKTISNRFAQEIIKTNQRLATYPYLGKVEPLLKHLTLQCRSLVIHPHYKLVYYVESDTVIVIDVWDTRRNPSTLANRVK